MSSIVMEEYELMGDSKYRSFMSLVDKALKSFEYTTEWADLIAALGKLNKVLISHMKFPIIPRRLVISKRLAQCMHPALPSGVHLKALDTYDIIFKCMGTNRLAQELFVYSAGLFPLFAHAAMHVRPTLLTVYETHFVPLGERLRPALNGFLSGVLPGLEEGSDHFDRTSKLLESVCEAVDPPVFYESIWECIASNQLIRLPAISFVLTHIDRKKSITEQKYLLGHDLDVMVLSVCSAVQDSSVLVQRNALDLLISTFPLHETFLKEDSMISIVTAACSVLLRRDMSLNRRLFNWLLGADCPMPSDGNSNFKKTHVRNESVSSMASTDSGESSPYFEFYSKQFLVASLRAILSKSLESKQNPDLKPYRLFLTLLEKPEIGPLVIDDLILDVFRALYHAYKIDPDKVREDHSVGRKVVRVNQGNNRDQEDKKNRQELIKSANLLFGSFESFYIWDFCGEQFKKACHNRYHIGDSFTEDVNQIGCEEATVLEMCSVIEFLLDIVSIETYVETHSEHLPDLFHKIMSVMQERCDHLNASEITKTLHLTKRILSKIQPAWNAWDAQEHRDEDFEEDQDDIGLEADKDAEQASEIWSKIAKDDHDSSDSSGEIESEPRDAATPTELGKEAVESLETTPSHSNIGSDPKTSPVSRSSEDYSAETIEPKPHLRKKSSSVSTNHSTKVMQAHDVLMAHCSLGFQDFFVKLMETKIFGSGFDVMETLFRLMRRPNDTFEERTKYLENMLEDKEFRRSSTHELEEENVLKKLHTLNLPLRDHLGHYEEALAVSCQILVDLSSIPTVIRQGQRHSVEADNKVEAMYGCSIDHIPDWLKHLLICACLLDSNQAVLQLNCVNALLEMIGLLQSSLTVSKTAKKKQPNNVLIVMMPLVKEAHYHCIMKQTFVSQIIALKLWEGLGSMEPVHHQRCVTLLHQLHNLAPIPQMVERILARSLGYGPRISETSSTVDAYQRFTLLWHLSRDIEAKGNSRNTKTFDVCLLKMLDNLNLSSGPLKALSQSWLVHALARGDIARLMEPLFLTLLDPSTARVSVLHAKIEHLDTVDTTDGVKPEFERSISDENRVPANNHTPTSGSHRIYAISSSNKEVVYHVSADSSSQKDRTDKAKKIFALTKFYKSKKSHKLSPNKRKKQINSGLDMAQPAELTSFSLNVNPFALVPPEVEDYSYFTRGYGPGPATPSITSDLPSSISAFSAPSSPTSTRINDSDTESEQPTICSENDPSKEQLDSSSYSSAGSKNLAIHPLHSHLLLYCQVCDSRQILYTMGCIKNIIMTNPRLAICTLSSTNLSSTSSTRNNQIQMLLARHRKSVFGKNFVGPLSTENMTTYRNSTLIEVLISTLLYYLRSYYPNLGQVRLSDDEIQTNREVQLMSIDILSVLVSELVLVVQDNGKAYATYISDLFGRCKVQKVVLHSLLAGINDMRDNPRRPEEEETLAFTEDILKFNEIYSTAQGSNNGVTSDRISNYSEAFQVQVLRLLLSLIMLEQAIGHQNKDKIRGTAVLGNDLDASGRSTPVHGASSNPILRYHNDHVIPDQPMFLFSIVSALRQEKMRHLHSHWTSLVTSCLPFLGKSLSQNVLEVTAQLCRNLEQLSHFYKCDKNSSLKNSLGQIPADYIVTQLEALTMIYHHCLLDSSSQISTTFTSAGASSSTNSNNTGIAQGNQSVEILSNLLHVFLSTTDTKSLASKSLTDSSSTDTLMIARKVLLSTLPRLVNTVGILWNAITSVAKSDSSCVLIGAPKTVKTRLLDMISPLAQNHPVPFMSAVGTAWQERKSHGSPGMVKHPLPVCNDDQKVLVELIGSIRALPVATVIQTVRQVLKHPSNVTGHKINVEVSVLQFFYAYLAQCSIVQIFESWSNLAGLLKDCLALAPPAIFLALAILNQFVHRSPNMSDRKEQKELQEIAGKLIEACAQIGGACLEQTTWLRRNLEVNYDLLVDFEQTDLDLTDSSTKTNSDSKEMDRKLQSHYAVPALSLLGELLAPLLDIIYQSEEKERVIPLLYNVMVNVIPYLKTHTTGSVTSFRACSRLLAELSEYQYTRKAWKKEGMDLLLDPAFFQMDLPSLQHWRVTVDNLMTHDKTTFKELMTKVANISQSGALNLFSTKDQEVEQRALLLRRLAFVIFCSEVDQYQKQMPEIQERLADSLRSISNNPALPSAVFLCFRVILVRMSSQHVTSLWPIIITEMVQIFSYLEQELSTDSEEWSTHLKRMSTLDSSWVMSAGASGLAAHNSPGWMALFLGVCKLLDLALALPAQTLPQFQMYKWAFVSESSESSPNLEDTKREENDKPNGHHPAFPHQDFVPYVVRVARLLLHKIEDKVHPVKLTEGQPILTMTSIGSLEDLGPFFASICENVTRQQTKTKKNRAHRNREKTWSTEKPTNDIIDAILEKDFLEPWPKNPVT
ncbi:protein dopey-1-like isoform X2 [Tigriopus californicus]|uniref:protein dopey-1-like isoform X2 n=1 Tax=Tigriopus californicus TaxID=6832 RepID=UPI0027DA18EA|nr:protein dopey-1-like isoform X2 [Tigriopus californicus]